MESQQPECSPVRIEITPIGELSENDVGAETIRNFRYQFAYAVVLLIAAATGRKKYSSIWCEQEDDILAQLEDELFDAYQVKTRKPTEGEWRLNTKAFVHSVDSFIRVDRLYPGCFEQFYFVSNVGCLDSDAKDKIHFCPERLTRRCREIDSFDGLADAQSKGFELLFDSLNVDPSVERSALFSVLNRLSFVKGPERDSFVAELAQNHLRELEWCRLAQPKLENVVWDLMEMVERASSLSSQDASRHLPSSESSGRYHPQLVAKKIPVENFVSFSKELVKSDFRYLSSLTSQPLSNISRDLKRFGQKLEKGGLSDYSDALRNQTLSAEAILLELLTRGGDGRDRLAQIENVVLAECSEAHLRASENPNPFGRKMLIEVQNRLRNIAGSDKVCDQPYEVLMGMAGLLTESCPVWWSERFSLDS